jgi:nonsense-mediated mRNA decay protein 3
MGLRVCPRCGRREEENDFVEGFCPHCYPEVRELARGPEEARFEECPRCGRARLGGEWRELTPESLQEWVLPKVKSRHEVRDAHAHLRGTGASRAVVVELTVEVEGRPFPVRLTARAPVTKRLCEDDVRQSAGYFEAVLQLRGDAPRVESMAERLAARTRRLGSFVTKAARVKGGLDLYLGSNEVANRLVRESGIAYQSSRELGGVKEGRRVYRVTYSLRV